MNIEIERKFLVKTLPDLKKHKKSYILQRYIASEPEIRLRKLDNKYIITKKGDGTSIREEEEIEVSEEVFEFLGGYEKNNFIEKYRYYIPLESGLIAELDEYLDYLEGFFTVEVEFKNISDMKSFKPPIWFGEELTEKKELNNYNVATKGLPDGYEKNKLKKQ